jgi:hypothetical protein
MFHPRSLLRNVALVASAALALATLVACSSAGDGGGTARPSFDVTVADPDDSAPVALSQTLVDGAALSTMTLTSQSFTEVEGGLWVGNSVDAGAGDTVTVTLPPEDEIPADALTTVEDAFLNATEAPDCSVQASSSSAEVSYNLFQLLVVPGLVAFTPDGLTPTVLSDAALDVDATDPPSDGTRFYTWIYADSAVDVGFTGSDCNGNDADLSLEAGWNMAAWVVGAGGTEFTLRDVAVPQQVTATVFAP